MQLPRGRRQSHVGASYCTACCQTARLRPDYRTEFELLRPSACRFYQSLCGLRSGTVFTVPGPRPGAGLCKCPIIIPHRPPFCVFGEGMTVHGGAQLHDVIGQGRHSSASFWRPLTGDDHRDDQARLGPFHHSCLISERLRHRPLPGPSRSNVADLLPGAAKGPCRCCFMPSPPSVIGSFPKRRLTKPSLARILHGHTSSHCLIAHGPMLLWPWSPPHSNPPHAHDTLKPSSACILVT